MALMVSVSGIRGLIGSTMTPQLAASAGGAFAQSVDSGRVVIGRDSRPSGYMVSSAVVSGLLAGGCDVVDLGIVTTPTVAIAVRELAAAGGIVITASHNPSQWNGIKFINRSGCAPPRSEAEQIIAAFRAQDPRLVEVDAIGRLSSDESASDRHVEKVLSIVDVERIRDRGFRVVLDSVNGAGGPAGRMLLSRLGCDVVHINAEPTGVFAHTPEPTRENLTDLCARTRKAEADVGFAQDPDADRLAIVDEQGGYIGEEYTLALAVLHILGSEPGPLCANLSTSRMIDVLADRATQAGRAFPVHRSPVGEANVVEVMKQQRCVLGGEGNGGVIDPRIVYVRDSLTAMAITLQVMTDGGAPLSDIVARMPRFAMVKQKFPCDSDRIQRALAAVQEEFAREQISTIDGIRIDWPEGWVHVRASNTEPIMRVIAEAEDDDSADDLITRVRQVVDRV
ncbi:MAG TPA: phosphoglucosamine mutase [Phycisphaerae bacterium]|nr:phosphoglucosamine mutase [Phycisphaerae bacterium]